jgi:uridine phosphorylase
MKHTELITNQDGSVFHLHIKKSDIAKKIIIVGDQGRVDLVSSYFDTIRFSGQNREFKTVTGSFSGKEVTVMSSGIGTDNIDILINELDAAVNFSLKTRQPLADREELTIVRLGTSGALQGDIDVGSFVASKKAIGFDGIMNFYNGISKITDIKFEDALMKHLKWSERLTTPYVVNADVQLLNEFNLPEIIQGITISAPGFYGPQGRRLYIDPVDPAINDNIETFRFEGQRIDNYEMESSAIYGLSKLLGHKSLTICTIIANRVSGEFLNDYKPAIKRLTEIVLNQI